MILASNKEVKSKEDVIKVTRAYFSRWKTEEYFRCKLLSTHFKNLSFKFVKVLVILSKLCYYSS